MGGPYIDDEEDLDEQRRREEEDSAPPVTIGAPAQPPPDVPPVASAPVGAQPMLGSSPQPMVPLAPVAHPDAPPVQPAHQLSPARQRLQQLIDQGAPPVKPLHGAKKFFDVLGQIVAPGIEQTLRYGPQHEYRHQLGQAESDVEADKTLHPEAPPKADEWTVVPGQTGPNGEPIQENKSTGMIRYAPGLTGAHPTKLPAPKINEVSGIPVSITDGKGKEYDIKDPNLPPELKPIADRALEAHGQHVNESRTPKFTAEQEAYAKKLGVKPEEVTSDQWEAYDKNHKQDIHITNPPQENGVIMSVPDGKGGHILQRIVPGQQIPEGSATPTQAGSVDINNEQGEKAGKDALQYADDYLKLGAFTGPGDEALMEKFFELAKPSSGFRMTQAQIDMLKNAQGWMNSLEAKARHAFTGTWFSDDQRAQIAGTMKMLANSRQPSGGSNAGGGDLGAAPAGKAEGSTGTRQDGTKVIVKGGRLHKQ